MQTHHIASTHITRYPYYIFTTASGLQISLELPVSRCKLRNKLVIPFLSNFNNTCYFISCYDGSGLVFVNLIILLVSFIITCIVIVKDTNRRLHHISFCLFPSLFLFSLSLSLSFVGISFYVCSLITQKRLI